MTKKRLKLYHLWIKAREENWVEYVLIKQQGTLGSWEYPQKNAPKWVKNLYREYRGDLGTVDIPFDIPTKEEIDLYNILNKAWDNNWIDCFKTGRPEDYYEPTEFCGVKKDAPEYVKKAWSRLKELDPDFIGDPAEIDPRKYEDPI